MLHRIVRKKFNGTLYVIQTKGDSLINMDEPVTEHDILGKVCRIEKKLATGQTKHIDMESLYRKCINYLLAIISSVQSRMYLAFTYLAVRR